MPRFNKYSPDDDISGAEIGLFLDTDDTTKRLTISEITDYVLSQSSIENESDPVFTSSAAYTISQADISRWNEGVTGGSNNTDNIQFIDSRAFWSPSVGRVYSLTSLLEQTGYWLGNTSENGSHFAERLTTIFDSTDGITRDFDATNRKIRFYFEATRAPIQQQGFTGTLLPDNSDPTTTLQSILNKIDGFEYSIGEFNQSFKENTSVDLQGFSWNFIDAGEEVFAQFNGVSGELRIQYLNSLSGGTSSPNPNVINFRSPFNFSEEDILVWDATGNLGQIVTDSGSLYVSDGSNWVDVFNILGSKDVKIPNSTVRKIELGFSNSQFKITKEAGGDLLIVGEQGKPFNIGVNGFYHLGNVIQEAIEFESPIKLPTITEGEANLGSPQAGTMIYDDGDIKLYNGTDWNSVQGSANLSQNDQNRLINANRVSRVSLNGLPNFTVDVNNEIVQSGDDIGCRVINTLSAAETIEIALESNSATKINRYSFDVLNTSGILNFTSVNGFVHANIGNNDSVRLSGIGSVDFTETDVNSGIFMVSLGEGASFYQYTEPPIYQGNNAIDPNNEQNNTNGLFNTSVSAYSFAVENTIVQNGSYSIAITRTDATDYYTCAIQTENITAGDEIEMSIWVYREAGYGANVQVKMDDDGHWVTESNTNVSSTDSGQWVNVTQTAIAAIDNPRIELGHTDLTVGAKFYVDNLTLTKIN